MTQEEKTKAYDEALKRAKEIHDVDYVGTPHREIAEYIFPELAESEDEKIRKEILEFVDINTLSIDERHDRWISWLEKQGQTFTKKDVDDAYLKGVFDTKQGKQDARYKYLEEIIAADDIYQMSMNDTMTNEAKEKATKALSKLCIGKLLGFEKQGEQKPFDYEHATITQKDFAPEDKCAGCNNIKGCIACVDGDNWAHYYYEDEQKHINDTDEEIVNAVKDTSILDMVEPKFKVGDWVVNSYGDVWHIDSFDSKNYQVSNGDLYCHFRIENQNEMHPWTIQDAKDGDVLYSPCCKLLWIYKDGNSCYIGNNLNYNENCVVVNSPICIPTDAIPATKEQRELLFKKMNEAGYTWNPDEKKLEKIEQKQEWSEEDERNMNQTLYFMQGGGLIQGKKDILLDWLKSIKCRMKGKEE